MLAGVSYTVSGGTLSGSGTINGSIGFAGGLNHLGFNIGGTTQGTGYDSLSLIALSVNTAELDVTVINGFASSITPQEQFVVVQTTEGVNGVLTNVANGGTLQTTDGLESFQVNYGSGIYADEVVLSDFQIIPEPRYAGAVILVAGLLMARRVRRAVNRPAGF